MDNSTERMIVTDTAKALYNHWLDKTKEDVASQKELLEIADNSEEILDRFYKNLEFGTAGLRGVLGAGTNRMNTYTVNQATQGLADYLNEEFASPSVAIAYDSRNCSDIFAKGAAEVLAANGIKVYIYRTLVPTPMLSFAVRELRCSSGIIITASHNPAKYNGYKCYDPNGYQMTDEAAERTYRYIQKTDIFEDVKTMTFEKGLESGIIEYIGEDVIEAFYERVLSVSINKGICKSSKLRLIYTPLNGTGNVPVREILKRIGQTDVAVVPEQEYPDGNFPTCPYPNPEIREAFALALNMAEENKADLLLATDPDCDRVGIAVRHDGEYRLMSGNEVGVLLTEYILSCRKNNGTLPEKPVVIKSFVTTEMVTKVAKKYAGETHSLLTGFKYIGELITKLEEKGEADRFTVGMEESYGYLSGTHARDKDAVVASMLITEMAAYYKSLGKTLVDVMNDLYREHGMYYNKLLNFSFEGASGMQKMQELMSDLRENAPKSIAELEILSVSDYKKSETVDLHTGEKTVIDLPKSNVIRFTLPKGSEVIVRPSGTEPKIKIYITSVEETAEKAAALSEKIADSMKKIMKI